MTNPADALHRILSKWIHEEPKAIYIQRGMHEHGDDHHLRDHRTAIKLINEIEMLLAGTERREAAKQADDHALAELTKFVFAYPHSWLQQPLGDYKSLISERELDYLLSIEGRINELSEKFTMEDQQKISEMLVELTSALASDQSLPRELKLHMRRLIVEVQTCIDEYEITGDFFLQSALDRLFVAVAKVENQSKEPGKWGGFRDKFVYPALSSLVGGAPGTLIALNSVANAANGVGS